MKSARKYRETALDELALLKAASSSSQKGEQSSVVGLLDHFEVSHRGSGTHICMVLEVLGDNLLRPIVQGNYSGMPIPLVKHITRQVLAGLSHLHTVCGIIHTDIKPENILTQMDLQESPLRIIGGGTAAVLRRIGRGFKAGRAGSVLLLP